MICGPFSSALVVPQSILKQTLEKTLRKLGVKILWNHEARSVNDEGGLWSVGIAYRTADNDEAADGTELN